MAQIAFDPIFEVSFPGHLKRDQFACANSAIQPKNSDPAESLLNLGNETKHLQNIYSSIFLHFFEGLTPVL